MKKSCCAFAAAVRRWANRHAEPRKKKAVVFISGASGAKSGSFKLEELGKHIKPSASKWKFGGQYRD